MPDQQREQPTQFQLEGAARATRYEFSMLDAVTRLIQSGHFADDVLGQNLVTECGLLHARNLNFFFGASKGWKDDVIALDYLPSWNPQRILDDTERTDINKKLAHITTSRAEPGRTWRMLDYLNESHRVFDSFVRQLDDDRATWFTDPKPQ